VKRKVGGELIDRSWKGGTCHFAAQKIRNTKQIKENIGGGVKVEHHVQTGKRGHLPKKKGERKIRNRKGEGGSRGGSHLPKEHYPPRDKLYIDRHTIRSGSDLDSNFASEKNPTQEAQTNHNDQGKERIWGRRFAGGKKKRTIPTVGVSGEDRCKDVKKPLKEVDLSIQPGGAKSIRRHLSWGNLLHCTQP